MATDNPNLAETSTSGGKTTETNPPKVPKGTNSSVTAQDDGASLPKNSQGVLKDTMTELNNLIPVAGCPIKLPNLMNKLNSRLKLWPETEANRLKEWANKIAKEFFAPIVDEIENWIRSIKLMIEEIKGYIKKITDLIKEIQEWIKAIAEFVAFIVSLPLRLAQLITNCLKELTAGATKYVSGVASGFSSGLSQGLSDINAAKGLSGSGIPMVSTTGNYNVNPPAIKTKI
jgi:hypothetical protein